MAAFNAISLEGGSAKKRYEEELQTHFVDYFEVQFCEILANFVHLLFLAFHYVQEL